MRARAITEDMKVAAATALADLAKEDVPDAIVKAYGWEGLTFGPDDLIPKPLDPRVLLWEALAEAQAAMETGVARVGLAIDQYVEQLEVRLSKSRELTRVVFNKASAKRMRVALADGEHPTMIRAAHQLADEGIANWPRSRTTTDRSRWM